MKSDRRGIVKENAVKYRRMNSGDIEAVCALMDSTWDMKSRIGEELGSRYSSLYTESILADSEIRIAAVCGGRVVGAVMGRRIEDFHTDDVHADNYEKISEELNGIRGGKSLNKAFARVYDTHKKLLNGCDIEFDGYLTFLAVESGMRGKGIGKTLVAHLKKRLSAIGVEKFYLYTDTTCNVGFYDSQGFKRINSVKDRFQVRRTKIKLEVYLYGFDLTGGSRGA